MKTTGVKAKYERVPSHYIQCPFFEFSRTKHIKCEGAKPFQFGTREEKAGHVNKHCKDNYKECPMAKKLYKKYGMEV